MEKRLKEQENLNRLNERLAEDGRLEDIIRVAKDPSFRQDLIQEYQFS